MFLIVCAVVYRCMRNGDKRPGWGTGMNLGILYGKNPVSHTDSLMAGKSIVFVCLLTAALFGSYLMHVSQKV